MKILSYKIEGEKIEIQTDNKENSHFVYNKNKFKNMAELEKEINKKIFYMEKEKPKKEHYKKIIKELKTKCPNSI